MAIEESKIIESINSGVDFANRRIYWGLLDKTESTDEFCWATVEFMVRSLHRMYESSNKPIELHFNSPGGEVYSMLRLMDEIESAPCQIKFIGSGIIASAATWVMSISDHRALHKNTVVMVHDGQDGFSGSHSDAQIQALHNKQLQDKLYDVFEANSRMPKHFWSDLMQRDLYLSPEECVLVGLCDEIIQPRKRGNVRKARQKMLDNHPEASEIQKLTKDLYNRIGRRKPAKLEVVVRKDEIDESLSDQVVNPDQSTQ
jgi:ATP-dependent protease ClpP protease subunit